MLNAATAKAGHQLSLLGSQAAADKADRVHGGSWSLTAWTFLLTYARKRGADAFMAEDVRSEAERTHSVPTPPDKRAWGQIIRKAAKARLITQVGYAPNKSTSCHGSPKAVWVWAGC